MSENENFRTQMDRASRTIWRLVDSCDGFPDSAYYDEEAMVTCGDLRDALTYIKESSSIFDNLAASHRVGG